MKDYRKDFQEFLRSKRFILPVLAVIILAYGFSFFNHAIHIDDLEADRYVGAGHALLGSGRFAVTLWAALCGYWGNVSANTTMIELVSVVLLTVACINFCILFRRVSRGAVGMPACTVFTCIALSYPLIQEVWEYTATPLHIFGSFLFVSFALLLLQDVFCEQRRESCGKLLGACLLMMLVCAGYESVVQVYIFLVCGVLALDIVYGQNRKPSSVLRKALVCAGVLGAGLVLRLVVHALILKLTGIEPEAIGATDIFWKTMSAKEVLRYLLADWIRDYLLRGIVYFPITELIISAVFLLAVGIPACKRCGAVLLIPGLGMYFSLIALSLVQGSVTPYRACQVFMVFTAYSAMIAVTAVSRLKKPQLRRVFLVACGALCFYQASFMSYFIKLNYVRWQQEQAVIQDISRELQAHHDLSKPVVFYGRHLLPEYLLEQGSVPENSLRWRVYRKLYNGTCQVLHVPPEEYGAGRKLPENNLSSVITWGQFAYKQEGMHHLFQYCGLDYVYPSQELRERALAEAGASSSYIGWPAQGYIQEKDQYILVFLKDPFA